MGERAVSHGVAQDISPRREPWGTPPSLKAPPGATEFKRFLSPLRGSHFNIPQPTADAVGYPLVAAPQLPVGRLRWRSRQRGAGEKEDLFAAQPAGPFGAVADLQPIAFGVEDRQFTPSRAV